MPGPVSKAQARFFGAIAGGAAKVKGFSATEAKNRLRGISEAGLPARIKKSKTQKSKSKK